MSGIVKDQWTFSKKIIWQAKFTYILSLIIHNTRDAYILRDYTKKMDSEVISVHFSFLGPKLGSNEEKFVLHLNRRIQ